MRKVTAAGKFGRLFMTAVMTCTLSVPTQALAAQDASGGLRPLRHPKVKMRLPPPQPPRAEARPSRHPGSKTYPSR